jgi:hypothetical protein
MKKEKEELELLEEKLLKMSVEEFKEDVIKTMERDDNKMELMWEFRDKIYDENMKVKDNSTHWVTKLILLYKENLFRYNGYLKTVVEYIKEDDVLKKEAFIKEYTNNYNLYKLELLSEKIDLIICQLRDIMKIADDVFFSELIDEEETYNSEMIEMLEETKSIATFKKHLSDLVTEINDIITKQTSTAATATEPELIDFSKDTDIKTKIAILQELGILSYLMKKPSVNSANKVASLLSAVLGIKSTTLQPYINPIFSPNADQTKAPKKTHKEKARQILLALDYTD